MNRIRSLCPSPSGWGCWKWASPQAYAVGSGPWAEEHVIPVAAPPKKSISNLGAVSGAGK
jgi:hypothetical protein